MIPSQLQLAISAQPYPLLFATLSGAHHYGFASPDSDYDLRGVHILPLIEVIGLDARQETIQDSRVEGGLEIDLVTHDLRKFMKLLLKTNGYVLEQLFSPLVVTTTKEHEELKTIARACITRHHAHHYLGFAQTQWKLFAKEQPRRVKPLLYVYRVLLTGIHLMRTGEIETNLPRLNEEGKLPFIDDLLQRKMQGSENITLPQSDLEFHEAQFIRLIDQLENLREASDLPSQPSGRDALNELLVRVRLSAGAKQ